MQKTDASHTTQLANAHAHCARFDAATGEMRVGIFAMRDIEPGEELTYDYMVRGGDEMR